MWIFYIGIPITLLLASYCFRRVKADYKEGEKLSFWTSVLAWIVYVPQIGLVIIAAVNSIWEIPVSSKLSLPLGILLIFLGSIFSVSGIFAFNSVKRMSGIKTNRLIRRGIYKWSRNPQNVGLCLMFLGVAVLGKSALALILVIFFSIAFMIYVPFEEKHLLKIFGKEYQDYLDSTSRYFGFPK